MSSNFKFNIKNNDVFTIVENYKKSLILSYNTILKLINKNSANSLYKDEYKNLLSDTKLKLKELEKITYELIEIPIFEMINISSDCWMLNSAYNNINLSSNILKIQQDINKQCDLLYFNFESKFYVFKDSIKYNINSNIGFRIVFNGESTDSLEVYLIVIIYCKSKNNYSKFVKLNSYIDIYDDIENLSFTINFRNSGTFKLNSLKIIQKEKLFLSSLSENNLRLKKFKNSISVEKKFLNEYSKPNFDVKIATILDEFSFECFSKEATILQLTSENWFNEIHNFKPDFLFVESAWKGKDNSWQNKIARLQNVQNSTLYNLVNYCKVNNIPTVFWNKEGLVNFETFKIASTLFEYIFLTDENIYPNQKELLKSDKINILPFAAQPKIHNSIDKNKIKLGNIAFAGTWYGNKHPNRLKEIEILLKPALPLGLDIFDRNYLIRDSLSDSSMYWPFEFRKNIIGFLPYNQLIHAYKNYDLFLNINSISDSYFMMPRRIYEILCCKTCIVSVKSLGIESQLKKDLIYYCNNPKQTKRILKKLLNSPFELERTGKKAQRYILENHTYYNRMLKILDTLEIKYHKKASIKVCVVIILNNISYIKNTIKNIKRQLYTDIEFKVLVNTSYINIDSLNSFDMSASNSINLYEFSTKDELFSLITSFNSNNHFNYFAFFSETCFYGANYIRDYVNSLAFVEADILGKCNIFNFIYDSNLLIKINSNCFENSYCDFIHPSTIFINKTALKKILAKNVLEIQTVTEFKNVLKESKLTIYSDDAFCFCEKSSSYSLEDLDYEIIFYTKDFETFVNI